MSRPLRSVLIGDADHYPSEYIFGVNQGMALLGHWHTTVSIRNPLGIIEKRLAEVQPDIIWGHMLLWAPGGEYVTHSLLSVCQHWKDRGTRVVIHDGDARAETRFPHDISSAVDLVLCNHALDRSAWGIPAVRWPYFAFHQERVAPFNPDFAADLAFAGRRGGAMYAERDAFLDALHKRLPGRFREFPTSDHPHTLFQTAELAASADAVLGYGRSNATGWLDVRVFQYPGAGGVLLHDDVDGLLEPDVHYIPYKSQDVDSVVDALHRARGLGPRIRKEAFAYVQEHHSSVARVRQALAYLDLGLGA